MNALDAQLSAPRTPLQPRGQARFEVVLEAAQALLREQGLAGFSIPALAERLGFTRASIYNFFPTPYAVLNELTRRELRELEQRLLQLNAATPQLGWRERIRRTVAAAADFYDERLVAQLLVLGGSLTDEGYQAQALTVQHLGRMSQRLFEDAGVSLPRKPVDVMALAVELGITCFRQSVLLQQRITRPYREEAVRVMVGYLQGYVEEKRSTAKKRPVALSRLREKG